MVYAPNSIQWWIQESKRTVAISVTRHIGIKTLLSLTYTQLATVHKQTIATSWRVVYTTHWVKCAMLHESTLWLVTNKDPVIVGCIPRPINTSSIIIKFEVQWNHNSKIYPWQKATTVTIAYFGNPVLLWLR